MPEKCKVCLAILHCPRCEFRQKKPIWTRKYCAFQFEQGEWMCWVAERKRAWPGRWAVGCVLCNNLMRHAAAVPDEQALKRTKSGCHSVWSQFEVERPNHQL